ncbi:hypothetical protein [Salinibacterium sp. ZJ450]|uniref:hypothetical protein n=1 Tax=Salinibacterium sp. ZJ450 TaxID=2708338 RepID=UPI001420C170|nr:hypothetical protein [Salinibacterium sp. ZJ450]
MSTALIGTTPRPTTVVRSRLRLTRRGRVVFTALASLPLVVGALVVSLNGGGAVATTDASIPSFEYVTVGAGESLWGLAESLAPSADPRDVITDILSLNQLSIGDVHPGVQLALPEVYSNAAQFSNAAPSQ